MSLATQLNTADRRETLSVESVRAELGISRERMARLLDVSARTVARWEDQGQLPTNRWVLRALVQAHNIAELARESLTVEGVRTLMTTPQPVFGNISGLEMIERGEADMVYRELAGMAEGYTGT